MPAPCRGNLARLWITGKAAPCKPLNARGFSVLNCVIVSGLALIIGLGWGFCAGVVHERRAKR